MPLKIIFEIFPFKNCPHNTSPLKIKCCLPLSAFLTGTGSCVGDVANKEPQPETVKRFFSSPCSPQNVSTVLRADAAP